MMDKTTENMPNTYLNQSVEVKTRFEKLKNRDVILEVKNLQKVYKTSKGETVALKNVSFKTHKREFVCIIGPSGCGKSTLARILAGLESYSGGEVLLDGKPIDGPGRERGMVFQGYT
jgi:NitT/TauT family transport system ATP-binding protein